ncbi:hypothetical protein [Bradyrhizobium sp. WSM1743]|uniref:hypothetical protein n=1 Tax=Bradyrhizobium sp. WSM1743 TaxID=318996 RepID=UPI0018DDDFB0|nr:hypothetical protein [Bradyrhizobium sp. WSM1743]
MINATMVAAGSMVGPEARVVPAIEHDGLKAVMRSYGQMKIMSTTEALGPIHESYTMIEERMSEFLDRVEWWIATWHAISAPNENAKRAAARLAQTIHKLQSMRGTLRFEDEPASFNAALIETKGKPL